MSEWKYPRHLIYSYYKRGGWYPSIFGGWTRSPYCITTYLDRGSADAACPEGCRVVLIQIEFRKCGNLRSDDPA